MGSTAVALVTPKPWVVGLLARQYWSVGGPSDRSNVSQLLPQHPEKPVPDGPEHADDHPGALGASAKCMLLVNDNAGTSLPGCPIFQASRKTGLTRRPGEFSSAGKPVSQDNPAREMVWIERGEFRMGSDVH